MLSPNPPHSSKPKPLIEQIEDELDETGGKVYLCEEASQTRSQEHNLLNNQVNYTNQQIHFFKQCYLPQILDSLYTGKIGEQEHHKIHETLCSCLISVENSLAQIEHPRDDDGRIDTGGDNSGNGEFVVGGIVTYEIVTLEDAKSAFSQSKNEFTQLKKSFEYEKHKNADLKNQQSLAVQQYLDNVCKIDDCLVQLKQIFDE
jgi:hypothetical protein